MTHAEQIQTALALLTLPVAVTFIVLFGRPSEGWWRTWFGRSLMILAIGVASNSTVTVLYRFLGEYPGRDVLLVFSSAAILVAMVIRTIVLRDAQRADRPHTGRQ